MATIQKPTSKYQKHTDKYTWYRRLFVVGLVTGKEYDLTWWVYGFVAVILYLIFGG